jgi:Flavinator of succinate dehydrogenase
MSNLHTISGHLQNNSDIRRRRLLFRSWHRGTQESDLILGSFANSSLTSFDSTQLDRFKALLDCLTRICSTGLSAPSGTRPRPDAPVVACFLRRAASQTKAKQAASNLTLQKQLRHGAPNLSILVCEVVPLADHVGPVDPAPAYRHCSGGGLDPVGLVDGRRRRRRRSVRSVPHLYRLTHWHSAAIRLCLSSCGISPGTPAMASRYEMPTVAVTPCSREPLC